MFSFDRFDEDLGWSIQPDFRTPEHRSGPDGPPSYPVTSSNSRGLRGTREFALQKPEGVTRILTLGDSFTFGDEVSDDQTWPYRLGQIAGDPVEVVNAAVHGYGHDQMLLRLLRDGLPYHPDVVVLGFMRWDMERNLLACRDFAKPRYVLDDGHLRLRDVPVPSPREVAVRELFRSHLLEILRMTWARLFVDPAQQEADAQELTAAILDEMRRVVEAAGAKFVIVNLPDSLKGSEFEDRFLESWVRQRGMERAFCQSRPFLKERFPNGLSRPGEDHYSPEVNAAVAGFVQDCLRDRLGW